MVFWQSSCVSQPDSCSPLRHKDWFLTQLRAYTFFHCDLGYSMCGFLKKSKHSKDYYFFKKKIASKQLPKHITHSH